MYTKSKSIINKRIGRGGGEANKGLKHLKVHKIFHKENRQMSDFYAFGDKNAQRGCDVDGEMRREKTFFQTGFCLPLLCSLFSFSCRVES